MKIAFDFSKESRRIFVPMLWMKAIPVKAWQSHHELHFILIPIKRISLETAQIRSLLRQENTANIAKQNQPSRLLSLCPSGRCSCAEFGECGLHHFLEQQRNPLHLCSYTCPPYRGAFSYLLQLILPCVSLKLALSHHIHKDMLSCKSGCQVNTHSQTVLQEISNGLRWCCETNEKSKQLKKKNPAPSTLDFRWCFFLAHC